ncbi:hypothetical protein [Paenibacillus terrae]|nr:hypothetical protein [Paenibacillus terrae]
MFLLSFLGFIIFLYAFIGLILGILWFALAKILELDNQSDYWSLILNSPIGLAYFLVVMLFFWFPALLPFMRRWKSIFMSKMEGTTQYQQVTWQRILLKPFRSLKEHIFNWYYIQ